MIDSWNKYHRQNTLLKQHQYIEFQFPELNTIVKSWVGCPIINCFVCSVCPSSFRAYRVTLQPQCMWNGDQCIILIPLSPEYPRKRDYGSRKYDFYILTIGAKSNTFGVSKPQQKDNLITRTQSFVSMNHKYLQTKKSVPESRMPKSTGRD